MIEIKDASREGAKVVIGLAGPSGSGKTRTAIELALGLAGGNASKIGFLDTENRRALLYSDCIPGKFKHGEFRAPFSPQRYCDAISAFESAGVEVLIIDSVSHEWEGQGGCEDIAHAGNPRFPRWNLAKGEHKKFMNHMLQCSMHVICCFRAREKAKIENVAGKQVFVPLGMMPVCEKNTMFEMTASVMMHDAGKRQEVLKCPSELSAILGRGNDYISAEDGRKLRAWIEGGEVIDKELASAQSTLVNAASSGLKSLEVAWKNTPKAMQVKLKDALPSIKASAAEFDRLADVAKSQGDTGEETAAVIAAVGGDKPEPTETGGGDSPFDV